MEKLLVGESEEVILKYKWRWCKHLQIMAEDILLEVSISVMTKKENDVKKGHGKFENEMVNGIGSVPIPWNGEDIRGIECFVEYSNRVGLLIALTNIIITLYWNVCPKTRGDKKTRFRNVKSWVWVYFSDISERTVYHGIQSNLINGI